MNPNFHLYLLPFGKGFAKAKEMALEEGEAPLVSDFLKCVCQPLNILSNYTHLPETP
jgi:hypothetical protein